jgi:hypothetical protein
MIRKSVQRFSKKDRAQKNEQNQASEAARFA